MSAGYGGAFARAVARVRAAEPDLQRQRDDALRIATELVQRSEQEQLHLLESDPKYSTWHVCDLLISESHLATLQDPASGEALANLAISLASRLDPDIYGPRIVADMQAHAWANLGNARRVNSDLNMADEALAIAESLLAEGVGDPLSRAQVLDLKASLRRDQRRFEESQELLDEVFSIYREANDSHLEGRALLQKAMALQEAGAPSDAIPLLENALRLLDPARDPRLRLSAYHCLAVCWIDSGEPSVAEGLLAQCRPLYDSASDFAARVRRRWLEGRLASAYERFEEAESAFLYVRREFLSRNIGYDAALVSLDLAALYASRGMTAEVKTLAEEMLPIFEARDIHREAAAALIIFQQAARAETVTLALTRQLTEYLRRSRRDPGARCEIQVA